MYERPHSRKYRRRNRRQIHVLSILLMTYLLPIADLFDCGIIPRLALLLAACARRARYKDRAEGSETNHGNGDASFELLPNIEPDLVECAPIFQAGNAHADHDCHENI